MLYSYIFILFHSLDHQFIFWCFSFCYFFFFLSILFKVFLCSILLLFVFSVCVKMKKWKPVAWFSSIQKFYLFFYFYKFRIDALKTHDIIIIHWIKVNNCMIVDHDRWFTKTHKYQIQRFIVVFVFCFTLLGNILQLMNTFWEIYLPFQSINFQLFQCVNFRFAYLLIIIKVWSITFIIFVSLFFFFGLLFSSFSNQV